MRSKRISAEQKAAREKERRKAAIKLEKSQSLVGNSKKNPDNLSSFTGTLANANTVSGQRLSKASLKNLGTKTRTETKLNKETNELKIEQETETKLNKKTETKLNKETNELKTEQETETKLNKETNELKTEQETETKLNKETNELKTEQETETKLNKETNEPKTEQETETKLNKETEATLKEIETELNKETHDLKTKQETETKLSKGTHNLKTEQETETNLNKETNKQTTATNLNKETNELKTEQETEIKPKKQKIKETKTVKEIEAKVIKESGLETKVTIQTKTKQKTNICSKSMVEMRSCKLTDKIKKKTTNEVNGAKLEAKFDNARSRKDIKREDEIYKGHYKNKRSNKRKMNFGLLTCDKNKNDKASVTVKKKCTSIPTDIQNQIDRKLQQLSEPDYGKWEVRLIDVLKQKPRTKIVRNTKKQRKEDVELSLIDSEKTDLSYCPLSEATKERLKKRTNSSVVANEFKEQSISIEKLLTVPTKTRSIVGDGNCFFRSLSFAIFGEECHHFKIRSIIVNHLLQNENIFLSFLRSGYQSVCNYVLKKGMLKNGVWATEVEIIAAAHLLQTDIFVFDDSNKSWVRFSGKQANGRLSVEAEAIYLKHCYRAHYEVVLSVKEQEENVTNTSANTASNNFDHSETVMHNVKVDTKTETLEGQRTCSDDILMEEAFQCSTEEEISQFEGKILQGNCHQGHPKFGASAGKQCVMNSLASLMYSKVKHTNDWNVNDMNVVLNTGNDLYRFLAGSSTMHNDYVLVTEIPRQIECFNKEFNFEFYDSLYGLINPENCLHDSDFQSYSVSEALNNALVDSDGAFVTFKGNTYIIIKDRNSFYVFDPHCRDRYGRMSPFGNSILLECNTVEDLTSHCMSLANSMNANRYEQFEVTGVKIANSIVCQTTAEFENSNQFEINEHINLENDQTLKKLDIQENYQNHTLPKNQNGDSMILKRKRKSTDTRNLYRKKKSKLDDNNVFVHVNQNDKRKDQQRIYALRKYTRDEEYKQGKIKASQLRYKTNELQRESKKMHSILKYDLDKEHRDTVKLASKIKYSTNKQHQSKVKESSIKRYKNDGSHKTKVKQYSHTQYKTSEVHRKNVKTSVYARRSKSKDWVFVEEKFRDELKMYPDYVCSVCYKLLFRKQVLICEPHVYDKKTTPDGIRLGQTCVSTNYLQSCPGTEKHICSSRCKLWVCFTCHRKLLSGTMPGECFKNKLENVEVPEILKELNSVERHLVSRIIPFKKMMALPKGGQFGVQGPVVCVPSNVSDTVESLPRPGNDNQLIQVKLKRKLAYKGHCVSSLLTLKRSDEQLSIYVKQTNITKTLNLMSPGKILLNCLLLTMKTLTMNMFTRKKCAKLLMMN